MKALIQNFKIVFDESRKSYVCMHVMFYLIRLYHGSNKSYIFRSLRVSEHCACIVSFELHL